MASSNHSVRSDSSSLPSRHGHQHDTDHHQSYIPRRSDDDDTIYTTEEELKQLLAKLDSAQGALISGKSSLSVTSKQSSQPPRSNHPTDNDSLDASTIPSLGVKVSNEELDRNLTKMPLKPISPPNASPGIARRNSAQRKNSLNSRPGTGGSRPSSSSGNGRFAKIPSIAAKDTDAFLKEFHLQMASLSNPTSPKTGMYGNEGMDFRSNPRMAIAEGEGEEGTPTSKQPSNRNYSPSFADTENTAQHVQFQQQRQQRQEEEEEDSTIQFINNRLFADTNTTVNTAGNRGSAAEISSYTPQPRYLHPTVSSVLPPYLHGEVERVRASYRTGSYNSLKKLPSKLEAGNVQLTAKQHRTVNLITSHNHTFKPASKLKDFAFQPPEHIGTDYEKVTNLNKFIFEEEKVQTESYSRKPFKISYRIRTKFEDTFFDPDYRVPDLGPGGNNVQLESVTRSDPTMPIFGKFHVARGKMSAGSGLVVKEWVKKMHQQLLKDWFDYEFRVKFTLSNEFLVQFLVPREEEEEEEEVDEGMVHGDVGEDVPRQQLRREKAKNKTGVVFPPPNNILPKYMARFATHGLGKEFALTKRGDRWNVVEEESSASANDTLSTADDDDSLDQDDEKHLEMLNKLGAISIGANGVVQAVRRFSMLRTDTSSRTTSRAASLDEYDNGGAQSPLKARSTSSDSHPPGPGAGTGAGNTRVSNVEQVSLMNIHSSANLVSSAAQLVNQSPHHYGLAQQHSNQQLRHSMSVALSTATMNSIPGTVSTDSLMMPNGAQRQTSGIILAARSKSSLGFVQEDEESLPHDDHSHSNNVPFANPSQLSSTSPNKRSTKSAKSVPNKHYLTFAFYAPWISCASYNTKKTMAQRHRVAARQYARKKHAQYLQSLPPGERGLPVPAEDTQEAVLRGRRESVGSLDDDKLDFLKVFSNALVTGKTSSALGHALLDDQPNTPKAAHGHGQSKPEKSQSKLEITRQMLLGKKASHNHSGGWDAAALSARDSTEG